MSLLITVEKIREDLDLDTGTEVRHLICRLPTGLSVQLTIEAQDLSKVVQAIAQHRLQNNQAVPVTIDPDMIVPTVEERSSIEPVTFGGEEPPPPPAYVEIRRPRVEKDEWGYPIVPGMADPGELPNGEGDEDGVGQA